MISQGQGNKMRLRFDVADNFQKKLKQFLCVRPVIKACD